MVDEYRRDVFWLLLFIWKLKLWSIDASNKASKLNLAKHYSIWPKQSKSVPRRAELQCFAKASKTSWFNVWFQRIVAFRLLAVHSYTSHSGLGSAATWNSLFLHTPLYTTLHIWLNSKTSHENGRYTSKDLQFLYLDITSSPVVV